MIRTTISKIKRVCTISFVPRLLWGNLRYSPSIYAAFGKFEKFTSNVKSVRKSTKATGDDEPLQPHKLKDGISVVSLSKPVDLTSTHEIETCFTEQNVPRSDNTPATAAPVSDSSNTKSRYDECSRVISEIFGDTNTGNPQEDLLIMGNVNMTGTNMNNKIITERKTYRGGFSRYDTKHFKTTPHVKIQNKPPDKNKSSKSKDNFQSVLYYEAVLTKEKEAKQMKESKSKPALVKQDTQQLNTCLYDVDPEEYVSHWKIDTKALKMLTNDKYTEHEIDAYWTDVYETAVENIAANYEPNQAIDLETIHMYKSLKGGKSSSKDVTSGSKRINHTPEELDRIMRGSPYDCDFSDIQVMSTTDKQFEDTLAQKIEHIDETPLVEAEQPKVEGFNTTPKVLGNVDKQTPVANKRNLDEVAHRCLNLPQTQVDKVLLKEMESLSVPAVGQKTCSETKTDVSLQKAKVHGANKSLDNAKTSKSNPTTQIPTNLPGVGGMKLSASTLKPEKKNHRGLKTTNTSMDTKEAVKSNIKKPNTSMETKEAVKSNIKKPNPSMETKESVKSNIKKPNTSVETKEAVKSNIKKPNASMETKEAVKSNIKKPNTSVETKEAVKSNIKKSNTSMETKEAVKSNIKKPNTSMETKEAVKSNIKKSNTSMVTKEAVKSNIKKFDIHPGMKESVTLSTDAQKQKQEPKHNKKSPSPKPDISKENDVPNVREEIKMSPTTTFSATPISGNSGLISDHIWGNDRLDPKYMLTVNEACPISPKAIVNPYHLKQIDNTESMYERYILGDKITMPNEKDDYQLKKLRSQTDEGCGFSALREIGRERFKNNDGNAEEARPLDGYMKIIQDANPEMIDKTAILEEPVIELDTSSIEPDTKYDSYLPELEITPDLPEIDITPEAPEKNPLQTPFVVPINNAQDIATTASKAYKGIKSEPAVLSAIEPSESVLVEETEKSPDGSMEDLSYISALDLDLEPYTAYEDLKDKPTEDPIEDSESILVKSILDTNNALQATTKQLQATSEKLHATSQQLHATSEQLQATSEKLDETCERIDQNNMLHTFTSVLSKQTEDSKLPTDHPLAGQPVTPMEPLFKSNTSVKRASETPAHPSKMPIVTTTLKTKEIVTEQETANADRSRIQDVADASVSSTLPVTDANAPTFKSLQEVKDNIKLSELMKLVKERNQRVSNQHLLTKPAEAKKSIPPMQQPRHKTPVFRPPSYPKLKPRPRVCAPRKKSGPKKTNCVRCDIETLGLNYNLGPRFDRPDTDNVYQRAAQDVVALTNDALPSANLTEEIILHLQNMGYILESAFERGKVSLESAVLAKTRYQFRTKDYVPWTPIPSWPFPKTEKRPKLQCPKDGCPPPPPRLIHDPPCGLKPCNTFPTYPRRTFSVLDYCTITLGDPTVVDIGEF